MRPFKHVSVSAPSSAEVWVHVRAASMTVLQGAPTFRMHWSTKAIQEWCWLRSTRPLSLNQFEQPLSWTTLASFHKSRKRARRV